MLPACLQSVSSVADEIIVVDTGSTDKTVEIAKEFGATVIEYQWRNDFAAARNVALAHATNPWILSIDADERLLNPAELRALLQQTPETISGILVNCRSVVHGDGGDTQFSSLLLRVFRNHPAIRFEGIIHEQVTDSMTKWDLAFVPSAITLHHIGYALSPEEMRNKQLRNLELLNQAIATEPTNSYLHFQRAKTYLAMNNPLGAEHDIQQALLYAPVGGTVRPQVLNYGAVAAFRLGDTTLCLERAAESLQHVPDQPFSHFIMAECYTSRGEYSDALASYMNVHHAIERNDTTARLVGSLEVPLVRIAFCIGRSYLALADVENASRYFEAGLLLHPDDVECRIGLAHVAVCTNRHAEARAILFDVLRTSPKNEEAQRLIAKIDMNESAKSTVEEASQRPFLSVSMIVKNEAHRLGDCLESVRRIADEVVIVDTGSTDNTVALAEAFGARVYHTEWTGDFAAARNVALQHTTGEWILYLDADERLTAESQQQIRDVLRAQHEQTGGLLCTIISPHRQPDDATEVHKGGYPRVFRNYGYPNVEFRGRVHEQISPSLIECGAHIVQSPLCIYHTGYDIDRDEMEKKVRRNYELLIQHVQDEPLNAYAWFQLGQTLGRMSMNGKAEESLRFALELGSLSTPVAASASATLAHICGTQQRYQEALQWAEYSLNKVPNQLLALNYKAYALMYLNRLDEAQHEFENVLAIMNNQSSMPESGYDVEMKPDVVFDGLKRIQSMRERTPVMV